MIENALVDGIVMVNPNGITRLLNAAAFMFAASVTLPVRLFIVVNIPASTNPNPAVAKLPPVILPVAETVPVTTTPVVANTATFDVPPMPTVTLPPELTTVTFEVPLLILLDDVETPVSCDPLPK